MNDNTISKNFNYEKINKILMEILERKYNVKIIAKAIKKEDLDG